MPRRPPPTSLRLIDGPLPPRGRSKFTLPSLPRPIFNPPSTAPRGPVPRARQLPTERRSVSPQGSVQLGSPSPSSPGGGKLARGPWDHSQSIAVPFDVASVLAAPKPAAVT
ncbi:hypothetical protein BV25DRAFT_1785881, partial [Artomyces pyxidatus]